jgi:hypothetical protein
VIVAKTHIDREKLRAALRSLGRERALEMLEDTLELLPQTKLMVVVKAYIDPAKLQPRRGRKDKILAAVKAFEEASLRGEYYEDFHVDSHNYMERSEGTVSWIAMCEELLDRCVDSAAHGDPGDVCEAFERIFVLLDRIDAGDDDIVFFADEGGSWQVGVEWDKVVPSWCRCLSAIAEPEDYARRVTAVLDRHCEFKRDKLMAVARKIGTPAQRKALRASPLNRGR